MTGASQVVVTTRLKILLTVLTGWATSSSNGWRGVGDTFGQDMVAFDLVKLKVRLEVRWKRKGSLTLNI